VCVRALSLHYLFCCIHSVLNYGPSIFRIHSVLNYDPRIRGKTSNMILALLMPPKITTLSAQKFYSLLEDELIELYDKGIVQGNLKGALLMVRSDQKGKEFDLGLRSCTSYDAPCSVCEIMADVGHGPFTKVHVGNYRRFLPTTHPYRRDPRFGPVELRQAPKLRSRARAERGVEIAYDDRNPLPFYQGYQHLPLFWGLPYFRPFIQSAPDLSHNLANFWKGIMDLVQPPDGLMAKWRREADASGRHSQIGREAVQTLDRDVARELRGLDLEPLTMVELQQLAKLVGVSHSRTKPELKARLSEVITAINDTGTAVVSVGKAPIPWVLSTADLKMLDSRCRRTVLPHGYHPFCTTKEGLFQSRKVCWRMATKMQVFMMFPTLFLGTGIKDLHSMLCKLAYAIRLMIGRVVCGRERRSRRLKTFFNHVGSDDLELCNLIVPEALSECERVVPPSTLRSHLHQMVHYPQGVDKFGSLSGCWMFGDERRNKVLHTHILFSFNPHNTC